MPLSSDSRFDDWFQNEIKWLIDPAWAEVQEAIEARLQKLNDEVASIEGFTRDRWSIFAPHPIKSSARVRAKILEDPQRPTTTEELRARVLAVGDLARLRIVASLKRDVAACLHALVPDSAKPMLDRFPIRSKKDFVRDEGQRRALAGHRAIQFVVSVMNGIGLNAGGSGPHVEIQIMTALQHVWDRRNHCVYEWLRAGDAARAGTAIDLRVDDHAIAETLHVADALADHNFETFLQMRREAP